MKSRLIPLISLVAFVVCLPSLMIFYCLTDPFDRPFERAAWRANSNDARFAMRNDLLCHYKIIGKNQNWVIALLGPPDACNQAYLEYDLGAVGIDSDTRFTLYLRNGIVQSCALKRKP